MANRKKLRNKKGEKIPRPKAKEATKELAVFVEKMDAIEGEIMDQGDRFGRPTVMTDIVKAKIIAAFSIGCTNVEAALFAGIGKSAMHNYFLKDPEFKAYCDEVKDMPTVTARKTLVKAIETSPFYALQYLERKLPHEFGRRVRHTVDVPEEPTPEEQELIDAILDENL